MANFECSYHFHILQATLNNLCILKCSMYNKQNLSTVNNADSGSDYGCPYEDTSVTLEHLVVCTNIANKILSNIRKVI